MRLIYFSAILLTMLTGCSVVTERTNYNYTSPKTSHGKRCAAQCVQGKSFCESLCLMKHPDCRRTAKHKAEQAFARYKHERQVKGLRVRKKVKDFEKFDACKYLCHCTSAYNVCYSACGGTVI